MKLSISILFLLCSIATFGQSKLVPAELSDDKSFSIIVIPDTQNYARHSTNQPILDIMTTWTAVNIDKLNIKTLLCTGDLVDQNDIRIPGSSKSSQTSVEQWTAISNSFAKLDNKLPYILCAGNHDYGYNNAENRMSYFHEYFPSERNPTWRNKLVSVGLNPQGIPTLENAAYEFETDTWGKLLVLSLEFAPRDSIIEWAKEVAKKYSDHRIILLTHGYLDGDGDRIGHESFKMEGTNYAEAMWDKLIKVSPNIRFVLCGHWASSEGYEKNVSFSTDINEAGLEVKQMMFNAQASGSETKNGGDGWLRILEFLPDGETIKVKTFSPLFQISSHTADHAWRRESYDQFEFKISKNN